MLECQQQNSDSHIFCYSNSKIDHLFTYFITLHMEKNEKEKRKIF